MKWPRRRKKKTSVEDQRRLYYAWYKYVWFPSELGKSRTERRKGHDDPRASESDSSET